MQDACTVATETATERDYVARLLTPTPEHPVTSLPATAPKTPAAVHVEGLAPGGRASVAASLHRAARIVEGHGHADGVAYPWHRRPPATLSKLRADLAEGYAVATANASVAAVRGALRAAWLAGELDRDGYERRAAALRTVSGGSAPGRAITPKEARKLFAGCAADPNRAAGARDAALLAVLYGLGLRRSEAVGLELADMDRAAGTLLVHGKGRRQRLAYLGLNGSAAAMAAWLAVRGDAPGPLFNPVNRGGRVAEGRSMTGQAVAARVIPTVRSRRAGEARAALAPTVLRHTASVRRERSRHHRRSHGSRPDGHNPPVRPPGGRREAGRDGHASRPLRRPSPPAGPG